MDAQSLKDMTRRWIFGLFDEGNFDLIGEMGSEEWIFYLNHLESFKVEAFRDLISYFHKAFPDLKTI